MLLATNERYEGKSAIGKLDSARKRLCMIANHCEVGPSCWRGSRLQMDGPAI